MRKESFILQTDYVEIVHNVDKIKEDKKIHNQVCDIAAKNGNLEILKLAKENDLDKSYNACYYAYHNGHTEIIEWLKLNSCGCNGGFHYD